MGMLMPGFASKQPCSCAIPAVQSAGALIQRSIFCLRTHNSQLPPPLSLSFASALTYAVRVLLLQVHH